MRELRARANLGNQYWFPKRVVGGDGGGGGGGKGRAGGGGGGVGERAAVRTLVSENALAMAVWRGKAVSYRTHASLDGSVLSKNWHFSTPPTISVRRPE